LLNTLLELKISAAKFVSLKVATPVALVPILIETGVVRVAKIFRFLLQFPFSQPK
jgi:hypothetical protein